MIKLLAHGGRITFERGDLGLCCPDCGRPHVRLHAAPDGTPAKRPEMTISAFCDHRRCGRERVLVVVVPIFDQEAA